MSISRLTRKGMTDIPEAELMFLASKTSTTVETSEIPESLPEVTSITVLAGGKLSVGGCGLGKGFTP